MKLTRSLVSFSLILSISLAAFLSVPLHSVAAKDTSPALQRGYRTGYSDGYMSGYRDAIDNAEKGYSKFSEYAKADRAYNKDYGSVEDYRDGYRQGFESGYEAGYTKRAFESMIPESLERRNSELAAAAAASAETAPVAAPAVPAEASPAQIDSGSEPKPETATPAVEAAPSISKIAYPERSGDVIVIPRDTELIVELQDDLTTATAKAGDKFTAKVLSPAEISGAMIEGRVERVQRPGRIKRRSELLLSFDRIVVSENRWSNFDAILSEVLPVKGDNVRRVDNEGTAVGKSSIKPDAVKVGAATGTGLTIGAVAAGPVGAAVGAGVGAAVGVGAVVIERGKNVRLNRSQQLRIKSSYETQIR